MGNIQGLLLGDGVEAAQVPDFLCRMLQDIMDKGTELRRIHGGFLPFLGPEAVAEEIAQTALRLPVDLGCGQLQLLAIELFNLSALYLSKRVILPATDIQKAFRDTQLRGCFMVIPCGQIRTGLISVCQRRTKQRLYRLLATGQFSKAAADKGGLRTGGID